MDKRIHEYKTAEAKAEKTRCVVTAVIVLLTIVYFAFLFWLHATQPMRERAAYLEGRYGLDRTTALTLARQGHGLTAQQILEEDHE